MDELLKSAPLWVQYVVLGFVGVGIAAKLLQNLWRGMQEPVSADVKTGNIVALNTATLADMSAVREAGVELSRNAGLLRALSEGLPELSQIGSIVRDSNTKISEALEALHRMEISAARREGVEDERARRRRED